MSMKYPSMWISLSGTSVLSSMAGMTSMPWRTAAGLGLSNALGGVVVADGDDLQAVSGAQVDELGWAEHAVGVGCVEMEVYLMHFGVLAVV